MKRTPLAPSDYYDILARHLVPMFPGSSLSSSPVSVIVGEQVFPEHKRALLVKPDPIWPYSLRLTYTQGFEADDVRLVRQFIRAFHEKLVASDQPFFRYLVDKCPEDVVAWSTQQKLMDDNLLPAIISVLKKWAIETYEGNPIAAAIGVDPHPNPQRISNIHFGDVADTTYAKVLSNGMDTLLVLSPSGHIVDHLTVDEGLLNSSSENSPFAPRRHLSLAMWATKGRVALALNRHGEILVFKDRALKFAFRSGAWSHFAHASMIQRMGGSPRLMRAVYASCLDVSFSRTGGCIAVAKHRSAKLAAKFLSDNDLLSPPKTQKTSLLSHLIGQQFSDIPRSIREEMTALDGATVLDATGTVIAAGAIVRVPGGSEGGGRLAAAKTLSRMGLAVKISADGGISAFSDRGTVTDPEVAFKVCV